MIKVLIWLGIAQAGLVASLGADESITIQARHLAGTGNPNPKSLEEWELQRPELRRQLLEMLGLWPIPDRTDLKATTTGVLEGHDFTVEKVHFQALPQVYVTGNLYLPKIRSGPAPAILYVCGHARVFTNGVSYGNKVAYQHHGIWFARNGYVCLTIDTLQLGEIEGLHHGTYREGRWWWNARGYTPAGVEAWFGIRALDYLSGRPEVDPNRLGMTGRSGGGSYTWTVAALDDRVKVAAPVAGITDLENQVLDNVVDGHCDCMFFLNQHRWDFGKVAALIAPRPLLLANSDKDTIFPLDGVYRVHEQVRKIYGLYGKPEQLGFLITPGPHSDTQDLQLPAFRWFNRHFKEDSSPIEMTAITRFSPEQLRVFSELPADELNTTIDEIFVQHKVFRPTNEIELKEQFLPLLRQHVFASWPSDAASEPVLLSTEEFEGKSYRRFTVQIQDGLDLPLWVVTPLKKETAQFIVHILDEENWTNFPAASWVHVAAQFVGLPAQQDIGLVYFAPRAVANPVWRTDSKYRTSLRRKQMLLGQTIDSMRVFDIRRAVQALCSVAPKDSRIQLQARSRMAVNAAYAALFEPTIAHLDLTNVPSSHREGPDYLNILKIGDIPDVLEILGSRAICRRQNGPM